MAGEEIGEREKCKNKNFGRLYYTRRIR